MEADLGIDSIKRVEILTSFARQFPNLGCGGAGEAARRPHPPGRRAGDAREPGRPANGASEPRRRRPARRRSRPPADGGGLDRYVIGMKESRLPAGAAAPVPAGALVITDDGRGSRRRCGTGCASLGGRPVIVRLEGAEAPPEGLYTADLSDQAQVDAVLDRIRRDHGRIGAVMHLLPLRHVPPVQSLSAETFGRLLNEEVKGLFYMVRHASADLRSAPGSWVLHLPLLRGAAHGRDAAGAGSSVARRPHRGHQDGDRGVAGRGGEEPGARGPARRGGRRAASSAELTGPATEHEAYYRAASRLVPVPWKVTAATERRRRATWPPRT